MLTLHETTILQEITEHMLRIMKIRNAKTMECWVPTVKNINCGDCFNWAWLTYHSFGCNRARLHSFNMEGHHAFVSIDGVFYDAEHLDGTPDWKSLDHHHVITPDDYLLTQTPEDFKLFWEITLPRFEVQRLERDAEHFRNVIYQKHLQDA